MSTSDLFNEAASAYEQVKATISQLKIEYATTCANIVTTESDLKAAQLAYVPVDDLKAGILDFVDASGMRYARDEVANAIGQFAQNQLGSNPDLATQNKPMRFCDIEAVVSGGDTAGSWAQLLTPSKHLFNDQVLYYFFAQLVKQGLAALMEGMSPSEFGYDNIHPDKIGSDRVTRRITINGLAAQLSTFRAQKEDLKGKLSALGVVVSTLEK